MGDGKRVEVREIGGTPFSNFPSTAAAAKSMNIHAAHTVTVVVP